MKLAIMQPYFLPYIGYFQLMAAVDKFILYDDVHFIKGGWINRNRILLDGRSHLFTVPLSGASPNRLINRIELVAAGGWRTKLIRTIEQAYRLAPQFQQVIPLIRDVVLFPERKLAGYLSHGLARIKTYLDIPAELVPTSSVYHNSELNGQDRILDICRQVGATVYINAKGGRELYDAESFRANKVALQFLESATISYDQRRPEFHPSLSIVDVLMFNPQPVVKDYLSRVEFLCQK